MVLPRGAHDLAGIDLAELGDLCAGLDDAARSYMHAAAQMGVVVHDGSRVDNAAHAQMGVRTDIRLRQDDAARLQHGAGADRRGVTDPDGYLL